MKTSDFYYELPKELIAQQPAPERDASRLLVYERSSKTMADRAFFQLPEYLRAGDVLVLNRTRVLPARLFGYTAFGGKLEFLLLKRLDAYTWESLVKPGRRAKTGAQLYIGEGLMAEVTGGAPGGARRVRFSFDGIFEEILQRVGTMPLPPYITQRLDDQERYQTVYATQLGSAAAPTAGLHFTRNLLARIAAMGVDVVEVLLHVGLGTFRPVQEDDIENHIMHSEYFEVPANAAERINAARQRGGRVICVGTTSARTLESATDEAGLTSPKRGWTNLFITPGYRFKAADALITNFHLPESTLLMLVSALCSREEILMLYEHAVALRYRFFSFGDAMLIV